MRKREKGCQSTATILLRQVRSQFTACFAPEKRLSGGKLVAKIVPNLMGRLEADWM